MLDECAVRAVRKIRSPKIHDGRLLITYSSLQTLAHVHSRGWIARAVGIIIYGAIEVRGELESETQSMIVSLMIWPGKNQSGIWLLFQATSFGKLDLIEKV